MEPSAVATAVDGNRLWSRLMDMAKIGATAEGGVNRQAFSKEDVEARRLLASWSRQRGYDVETDAIGNIFVRRSGRTPGAPAVLTGSHLDSQISGGRFDGAFGVLAGFEVLETFDDVGLTTDRPVEVVAWSNEEGSRFQPGAMGSMVFTGSCRLEEFRDVVDRSGVPLYEALETTLSALSDLPNRTGFGTPCAYVEAHIEQGPRLEGNKSQIGIVTGIQGTRWFDVDVRGSSAHAGTTPRRCRADALQEAITAIFALRQKLLDPDDVLRFTVGRFDVMPNSPNTVPERVSFSLDIRHPDGAVLNEAVEAVPEICQTAMENCTISVKQNSSLGPCRFSEKIVRLVESNARELGFDYLRLPSGAFHDALYLAAVCPTGMIFVPSEAGISHSPAESSRPGDIAAGTRVLASVLTELANTSQEFFLASQDNVMHSVPR